MKHQLVLGGSHREEAVRYTVGQTVNTDLDLDGIFKNHFECTSCDTVCDV